MQLPQDHRIERGLWLCAKYGCEALPECLLCIKGRCLIETAPEEEEPVLVDSLQLSSDVALRAWPVLGVDRLSLDGLEVLGMQVELVAKLQR